MLPDDARLTAEFKPDLLKGVVVIKGKAFAAAYDAEGKLMKQARDFTAIAIVERAVSTGTRSRTPSGYERTRVLRLRHLERMPLAMPYPDMVDRVRDVMRSPPMADGTRHLAVDSTGVGRPVVDLLKRAGLDCRLWPVTITGGQTERRVDGYYRVPKRDLIVGLQVLLQSGELQIASGLKEGRVLLREMAGMQVKLKLRTEEYGAWRQGEHDDLVLAVALACWAARKGEG